MSSDTRKLIIDRLKQQAREYLDELSTNTPGMVDELVKILKEHENYQNELEAQVQERTRELSARNEILETIVDNIPVMITFYDSDGKVYYINPMAERIFGMDIRQMQRIDLVTYLYPDPEYRRRVFDFMKQASGEWKDLTLSIGENKTLDCSWANVRLSNGTYIGIGIDISGRKQAESKIEQYIKELEWKNRELQEFASVASHDLQEPLRKVQAFGKLLAGEPPENISENGRDYLSRMIAAADRMQSLIKSLLIYSRISARDTFYKRVDLKEITEKAINNIDFLSLNKKASFDIGNMDIIEADEIQMGQLMQNLIINSLNYSKKDEPPQVSISTSRIQPLKNSGKTFCEIRVSDNGIGFDTRYLEKIFMPFERLHARHQYSGTGMGLAICRKISERHGGWITAESDPGCGTTFIVTLPLNQKGNT